MDIREQNLKLIKEKLMNSKLMKEYSQVEYPEVNVDYDLVHDTLRLSTGSSDYGKSVATTDPHEFEEFINEILGNINADLCAIDLKNEIHHY